MRTNGTKYVLNRVTIAGEMARRFIGIKELAEMTGLSRNTVGKAVGGVTHVNTKTVRLISGALNLDYDSIVEKVITAGADDGKEE